MRKSFVTIIICLISTLLLAGCGAAADSDRKDKPENVEENTEEAEDDSKDGEIPEKKEDENVSTEDVTITDVSWNYGSYEEFSENNSDATEVYFTLSNGDTITKQVPLGTYVEGKEELDLDGDGEDEVVIHQYFSNTAAEYDVVTVFKLRGGNVEEIFPVEDIPELMEDVADTVIKPLDKEGYPGYMLDVTTYQKDEADVSVKYHALLAWNNGSWEEIEDTEATGQTDTAEEETIPEYFIYVKSPDGYANLRTGPGTEYDVICQIPTGDSMEVYRETATDKKGNQWLKVAYWHPYGQTQGEGSDDPGVTETGWIAESQVE
ncbi:MAG: SH3 domain-containing protein [Lachnospiraceae bacterium]|nr:SH3 domain-containing protein [Lachnospiraceae bacterium]